MADLSQYVDPFHGTLNGGNMFPGVVAAPFAVVKLGPDVTDGTADAYSGYLPDGNITAFTMMHESGTGGAPKYGVVPQLPLVGNVGNPLADLALPRAAADKASVGYYTSSLANGVTVQLAATEHAGLFQYGFPSNDTANVLVDVSHVLRSYRGLGWGQSYLGGGIGFFDDGHYEGNGSYDNGWNLSPRWTIYFCGKFSNTPKSAATFLGTDSTLSEYGQRSSVSSSDGARLGAVFNFGVTSELTSRVGISWVSSERACTFIDDEMPEDTTLSSLVTRARSKWNTEIFDKLTVSSSNTSMLKQLYSSLYGMFLIPSNRTGENPGWTSDEPYYDDIFTFWDLFRCTSALVHIIQPVAWEEQIRSLIDIWRHDGYMPDARSSNYNGRTQGGSNADQILADAYVKGVRGKINWQDGYLAMKKDAEVTPTNNNDTISPDSSDKEGRGALPDWKSLGWITPRFNRAVSRAVEYAVNDFGLYQVAQGMGFSQEAQKYLNRSRNWRNHWNPQASALGSSGFMVPRNADGSFESWDPTSCGGCYWSDPYYQGTPWEYSLNAHHDANYLVSLSGGNAAFKRRLDTLFDPSNGLYSVGNEPSFTSPYLYHFIGQQHLSVNQSRHVANTYYSPARDGIPGNSDAGAMQSWILWNMIGLYPMTGQTTFLIGSPWFERLDLHLGGGKLLEIRTTGGTKDAAFYVQSLTVNGKQWQKNWVTWEDVFAGGGTMEFVLGAEPARWDTGPVPPSPAS